MNKNIKFIICAGGIFICYFYFGILQEKITRGTYGDGEKFTCYLALVCTQCIANSIFAHIMLLTFMKDAGDDYTKTIYYASSALTYLLAMVCSNMALKWISYPTQVIGKSCKPIPVMILGVLLGKKNYPLRKYLFVFLIVIGVATFIYKEGKNKGEENEMGLGELLLVLSLTMDGLTGAIQERMRLEHQTRPARMMFNMNLWSVLFLGASLFASGEALQFISFVQRHPQIINQLVAISIAGSLGQLFIFLTVTEFGPLPCSIATTTRKFFTVLYSVLFFGNSLIPRQWLATGLVFAGLFLDIMYGKSVDKKK